MVSDLPFTEKDNIRFFSKDIDPKRLVWHWDEQDRTIKSIEATDWLFQFDNQLPIQMNKPIFIPAGTFHRLIIGTKDLSIEVIKHEIR